jgi:hypothetical protein
MRSARRLIGWTGIAALVGLVACTKADYFEQVCQGAAGSAEVRAEHSQSSMGSAVVVLAHSPNSWYMCSGVLVGDQAVLTAAHCVHGDDDWMMDVYVAADLLFGGPSIGVGSWSEHPTQDLAVLFLDEIAPLEVTRPRWSGDDVHQTQYLSVTGYGGPEGDVSRCLRVTEGVQDIAIDSSRADGTRFAVLVSGNIYHGDSGGPLVFDDGGGPILLGILGEVTGWDASYGSLGYYERLRRDDPWVMEAMPGPATPLP